MKKFCCGIIWVLFLLLPSMVLSAENETIVDDSTPSATIPDKNMGVFSQQVQNLQQSIDEIGQGKDDLVQRMTAIQYSVYGLGGVLIILNLISLFVRRKPEKMVMAAHSPPAEPSLPKTVKLEDDTRSEYDFMGSSEAIPAKLDLARAYIAMEDFNAARETLTEILGEGAEEHKQEARALLKKFN